MSAPAQMGPLARLGNVYFAPGDVFEDVRRSPRDWWLPFVVFIVIATAVGYLVQYRLNTTPEAMAAAAIDAGLEQQGKTRKDLSDQEKQAVEKQEQFTTFLFKVGPAVTVVYYVIFVGVASLLYWVIMMIAQAKTTFFRVVSVVTYAYAAPNILKALLQGIYAFLASPDSIDIKAMMASGGLLTTSLSFLTSAKEHPALWTLLNWFDLFSIWFLILLAIGLGAVALKRLKMGTAIAIAASPYVVLLLIGVAFKLLFSK
jgi:Yip1-like protein